MSDWNIGFSGFKTSDDLAYDLAFANAIAKINLGGKLTTYEKQIIRNYMNIEYGSGASIEQLTMAYGYFGSIIDKLKADSLEVPNELQTAFDASKRDLNEKLRNKRLEEIRVLELKREQLLSADEKRAKIEAEITRLEELTK